MKPLTELAFVCPISTSRAIHGFVIPLYHVLGSVLPSHFSVRKLERFTHVARLEASSSTLFSLPSRANISAGDLMANAGVIQESIVCLYHEYSGQTSKGA